MPTQLPRFVLFLPILFVLLFLMAVKFSGLVFSATADHLVISEVQIAGAASGDDFVEIYNPTNAAVNLGDLRLVKRTATGSADTSIVAFNEDDVIPAHGFFLWCNTNLNAALGCNRNTSQTVANNNSVALRNGLADTGTVVDAVAFGTVSNGLTEGAALTAPSANQSVERKANASSTGATMIGADALLGNGEDTDNNSNDFILREASQPQNASSSAEPVVVSPSPSASVIPSTTPAPSASPTVAPTVSPTIAPTASPTPVVTPTPVPTASPSLTPTPTPVVTPTPVASATPAISPTVAPTLVPSPSASASASPSATPRVIAVFPFFDKIQVCTLSSRPIKIGFLTFHMPTIDCFYRSLNL